MKNTQNKPAAEESTSVRLDKWLWAARFFKTRTLSQDNIELGRIRMNGVRLKASKEIKIGDQLEIIRGEEAVLSLLLRPFLPNEEVRRSPKHCTKKRRIA